MKPGTTRQTGDSATPQRVGLSRAMIVVGGLIVGVAVLVAMFERGAFRGSVPDDAVPRHEVASAPAPTKRAPATRPALPQAAQAKPALAERPFARSETKLVLTQIKAQKYVEEAYPAWLRAHPGQECPHTLIELNEYMDDKDANDAWGRPMRMLCGAAGRSGATGIKVTSYGRDGERSEDDIHFGN